MGSTHFKVLPFLLLLFNFFTTHAGDTTHVHWHFDNLNEINGITPETDGTPKIIDINDQKAVLFNGVDERMVMADNPIAGWDEFTIEVIFRVDKGGVDEQKFFHLQANPDIRILFELEFENDSMWYMENYIQTSGDANIHLEDPEKLYPTGKWCHAAVVYKNNNFKQYINYNLDNTNQMNWEAPTDGSVSIGARMNEVNYMKGAVRQIRFSNAALEPEKFMAINNGSITGTENPTQFHQSGTPNNIDIQVWPNPVYNRANIKISSNTDESIIVDLYSFSGQKIKELYSGTMVDDVLTIPFETTDIKPGTYIIHVHDQSEKTYMARIVVF